MKIKRYVGASMSECLLQVKKELGENAVILDSRKARRGGAFSFLRNEMIEVTASTADRHPPAGLIARKQESKKAREQEWHGHPAHVITASEPSSLQLDDAASAKAADTGNDEFTFISDEIRGLKETVYQLADHVRFQQLPNLPPELERLHRELLENGVEDSIAKTITQEITLELSGREFEDRRLLTRALREKVGRLVKSAPQLHEEQESQRGREPERKRASAPWVIALIGPTGVGKTTTLAKMATHPEIYGRKRVALVSVDTYRIAAIEQLKTFASIAGIPMEAVYRPPDVRRALTRFRDKDIILIDTAGRSQNDRGQLQDLAAFMDFAKPDEINLVLSMTTRLEDQLDVIQKFKPAGAQRLLFTKLDETSSYGSILNVCFHEKKPVSLLTCGQNVPDDIIAPNQAQLISIVSDKSYYSQIAREQESKRA